MDLKPERLQEILTDSFHPMQFASQTAVQVLGVGVSKHRTFGKAIPNWRWPVWSVALEDMLTKGDPFSRTNIYGCDWSREGAPRFKMVQTGIGKSRSVLSDGIMVIQHPTKSLIVTEKGATAEPRSFVLHVQPGMGSVGVSAIGREDQQRVIEEFFKSVGEYAAKNNFYRGQKIDANGRFMNLADVEEADLVLPEPVKKELFLNVKTMIEKWDVYAKFGIPGKRGVILAGPPGSGKTTSIKVLAKSLPCTFLWCLPNHVLEHDGFTEIFAFARELAPTVLVIEDADVFGLDRRIGGMNPLLGELLNNLDGLEENKGVITILSSNYAEMLDAALTRRPGRFDTKIFIGPPGPNEGFEILRRTLEKRGVVYQGDPGVLKGAANRLNSVGASGAHFVEVVNYSMMLSVERGRGTGARLKVTQEDIQDATARIVKSLSDEGETEKALQGEGIFKWGGWQKAGGSTEEAQ